MSQNNHLKYLDLDMDSLNINRTQVAQLKRLIGCIKPNLSKMQRNLDKAKKYQLQMERINVELMEENEAYCRIIDSIIEGVPVTAKPELSEEVEQLPEQQEFPEHNVVTEKREEEREEKEREEKREEKEEKMEEAVSNDLTDDFFGQPVRQSKESTVENPFLH